MELSINITGFNSEVTAVAGRKDNIRGFADWTFSTSVGELKVKGGTIREKEFGSRRIISYEVPAIRTGKGIYKKAFFMEDKVLYLTLCKLTVEKYCELTGEEPNNVIVEPEVEDINIDEIPI